MDIQKYFKPKSEKKFKNRQKELPEGVDTEGTHESREKIKKLHLLVGADMYKMQGEMKAEHQAKKAILKTTAKKRKLKPMSMKNTDAAEVYVGTGTRPGDNF